MRINPTHQASTSRAGPLAPAGPQPAPAARLSDAEKAAVLTTATQWLTLDDGAHMKERMPIYEGIMQSVTRGDRQFLLEHGSAPADLQDSLKLQGFTLGETNKYDSESYMRHELGKLEMANTAISEYEKRQPAALMALERYKADHPKATPQQTLKGLTNEAAKELFRLHERREGILIEIEQYQNLKAANLL